MASTEENVADAAAAQAPAPALPDFYTDANAVLKDEDVQWRFGRAPDYSKTRKFWTESKLKCSTCWIPGRKFWMNATNH